MSTQGLFVLCGRPVDEPRDQYLPGFHDQLAVRLAATRNLMWHGQPGGEEVKAV